MIGSRDPTGAAEAELSRVAVQLLVYSDEISPDEIESQLNIRPTRKAWRGVKRGGRTGIPVSVPHHMCEFSSETEVSSRDFSKHLDWMLAKLVIIRNQLRALRDRGVVHCELIGVVWSIGSIAHVQIACHHMEKLIELQLDMQLEFADYGDDD